MQILGIDPGSAVTGYGLIYSNNSSHFECVTFGSFRFSSKHCLNDRLKNIYDGVVDLIKKYRPDSIAFEDVFYGRNIQSALKLGQARGAAVVAAMNQNIPIATYSAREIKLSLTGYGAASKEQVQRMIKNLFRLKIDITPLDASDALAIALCHAFRYWNKNYLN